MMVSGITGISGMNSYRISSIHGNPYTLNPVSEITEQTEQSGRPLVIAADKKDELYVKDYGELKNTGSTATGDFAEMLGIWQDMQAGGTQQVQQQQNTSTSYYNDMIGLMGYQNAIRDQLGTSFIPLNSISDDGQSLEAMAFNGCFFISGHTFITISTNFHHTLHIE